MCSHQQTESEGCRQCGDLRYGAASTRQAARYLMGEHARGRSSMLMARQTTVDLCTTGTVMLEGNVTWLIWKTLASQECIPCIPVLPGARITGVIWTTFVGLGEKYKYISLVAPASSSPIIFVQAAFQRGQNVRQARNQHGAPSYFSETASGEACVVRYLELGDHERDDRECATRLRTIVCNVLSGKCVVHGKWCYWFPFISKHNDIVASSTYQWLGNDMASRRVNYSVHGDFQQKWAAERRAGNLFPLGSRRGQCPSRPIAAIDS